MILEPGTVLAHYRLVAKIGEGGMGEVWRATDTTLDRDVAVKVLPAAVAADPERRARFEREAKVLASLNHANIATIHGHHEAGGVAILVMELVPGEDLAERLRRGPIPVAEAIEIAREVAAALAAAHDLGIVHRDLKPANVKRTPDHKVKVLDFGLAKAVASDPQGSSPGSTPTILPTITSLGTAAGMILGTAAYMSPEQARGLAVDRRTDLWAFGCLLYEMLTGKRAFDGATVTDVLAAVVTREPDWDALPPGTPASVRRLLRRCLEKDARRRIRDAGDAGLLLDEVSESRLESDLERPSRGRAALPWAIVAVLAAALAGTWLLRDGRGVAATTAGPIRLSAQLPGKMRMHVAANLDEHQVLAISPDGSTMVLDVMDGNVPRLVLRRLDSNETTPLAGTEEGTSPFFSPDGKWVGFFSRGRLKKVATAGGQPLDLAEVGIARGGAWGPDGTIVFAPTTTSGLLRVPADGGKPSALTTPDPEAKERTHRWPAFLPGGREVAFTVGTADRPGAYEDCRIDAVSLADGTRRTLVQGASMARPLASGGLLLGRLDQVLAVGLDGAQVPSARNAVPVLDGVAGIPTSGAVFFDVAANGTVVYVEADPFARDLELGWISRDGSISKLPLPPRRYLAPVVSPDGRQVAVGVGLGRGGSGDVWLHDASRGTFSRFTLDGWSTSPVWSPDGRRIVFGKLSADGRDTIAWKAVDGSDSGTTIKTFDGSTGRVPIAFAPDGRTIVVQEDGGPGHSVDQLALNVADGTVRPILNSVAVEMHPSISPDGRWLAYVSDETGTPGVYVQAFPGPGGRWQIADRGEVPRWSRDGRELYYADGGKLYAVPVTSGAAFSFGTPKPLFDIHLYNLADTLASYDTAPDGRFLAAIPTGDDATSGHVNVVLGFSSAVGER